ncbi:aliphatic sulfonate ABC transporter substrate-binding protein [Rothia nasimurium]|uniref:Putative aliphatic sulfonates-binding protein n=1 Tax=Rothia nasimurium TaxID=85336 RepID=A0A4Y9F160_9MICC|nr:aliphatic sulfonate ABC transporter substrate-binding protein [Rothia nasimurium]MBF0809318.1 aliphatic sulfonate ABC transporter substrate-binding protein [Rothia nasimurium]TFU19989.1 aliphatic sulfonate ABC transporter substrate-binding protein [Rothia nasimurium]
MSLISRLTTTSALLATGTLLLTGCLAGENASTADTSTAAGDTTVTIDYATYNPLSLIIKEKGWLETALEEQGKDVEWVQSAGSNKANEALRSGAIDVGSTAGSAALLARSNGSSIQVIDLYSQPEWSALVTRTDTGISSVKDLAGKKVAVTKGTDPYFFLLQALEEAGVSPAEVTIEQLQHADGRTALNQGTVDAWSGLDPIMASAEIEDGNTLFYRNIDFNTYGFLNATEDFIESDPEAAQTIVDVYEYARDWALANEEEAVQILADGSGIELETAQVVWDRTYLDIDNVPGDKQLAVLEKVGPYLVESGDVAAQGEVDTALGSIVNDTFAQKADPARISTLVAE